MLAKAAALSARAQSDTDDEHADEDGAQCSAKAAKASATVPIKAAVKAPTTASHKTPAKAHAPRAAAVTAMERMQVDDDIDDGGGDSESDDDDDGFVGSSRRNALGREDDHGMARVARAGTSKKRVEELAGRAEDELLGLLQRVWTALRVMHSVWK